MQSYRVMANGVLGNATRLTKGDPFRKGALVVRPGYVYYVYVKSTRVDVREMDGYKDVAVPQNMEYYDGPFIPWYQMSLDNMPPYGKCLSSNQVVHMSIFLRVVLPSLPADHPLPAKHFAIHYPVDIEAGGHVYALRKSIGLAWDGSPGHPLPQGFDIRTLFKKRDKYGTLQPLNNYLAVVAAGPITFVEAEFDFSLPPTWTSCGNPMNRQKVIEEAEKLPPIVTVGGQAMQKWHLLAWLHQGDGVVERDEQIAKQGRLIATQGRLIANQGRIIAALTAQTQDLRESLSGHRAGPPARVGDPAIPQQSGNSGVSGSTAIPPQSGSSGLSGNTANTNNVDSLERLLVESGVLDRPLESTEPDPEGVEACHRYMNGGPLDTESERASPPKVSEDNANTSGPTGARDPHEDDEGGAASGGGLAGAAADGAGGVAGGGADAGAGAGEAPEESRHDTTTGDWDGDITMTDACHDN